MRSLLILIVALAALGSPARAQAPFCKLALSLALDISSSVNAREYELQLQGLANALETAEVVEAMLVPEGAYIVASVYEWSGYQQQDLIIDWTVLDSPAAVTAFASRLRAHKRRYAEFATALGKGVEFGAKLFQTAPPCSRQVLDVSGDGANNDGVGPEYFREQGLLNGLVINGLVILGATPNPSIYYREHVMQGPESFVALARDFDDYRDVMVGKLLREINTEMVLGGIR
ncbi:MAG: DUF1194 domain-containing protein [Pseudomonadota bacterium]